MCPDTAPTTAPGSFPLWFAALVTAISVPFACWVVLFVIEVALGGSPFGEEIMRSLGAMMFIGIPMSLLVMFLLGYPLALLLRRFGKLSALTVCAGGAVIGALFALASSDNIPVHEVDPQLVLFAAGAGLFAGIVFCLVAGIPFRRPTP